MARSPLRFRRASLRDAHTYSTCCTCTHATRKVDGAGAGARRAGSVGGRRVQPVRLAGSLAGVFRRVCSHARGRAASMEVQVDADGCRRAGKPR